MEAKFRPAIKASDVQLIYEALQAYHIRNPELEGQFAVFLFKIGAGIKQPDAVVLNKPTIKSNPMEALGLDDYSELELGSDERQAAVKKLRLAAYLKYKANPESVTSSQELEYVWHHMFYETHELTEEEYNQKIAKVFDQDKFMQEMIALSNSVQGSK